MACLGITGCSGGGMAVMGADAVTQLASGRSIPENLVYALTGKDCVLLNPLAGKPMCPEDADGQAVAATQPPTYCYRTLGQVDCYTEPDPLVPPTTRLYREEPSR